MGICGYYSIGHQVGKPPALGHRESVEREAYIRLVAEGRSPIQQAAELPKQSEDLLLLLEDI